MPYYHLVLAVVALIPTYLIRFSINGIPTNIFEIGVLFAFVVGVSRSDIRRTWVVKCKELPRSLILLTLLFLIAVGISTCISPHVLTSLGILKGWVVVPLLLGWIAYASSSEEKQKMDVLDALIVSGVVVALLGISQLGVLNRIQSIYDVPNSLALFLAPLTVAAAWRSFEQKNRKNSYYNFAVLIMGFALVFTKSVMGVMSIIAALIIGYIVFSKQQKVRAHSIYIIGIALGIVLMGYILTPKLFYLLEPNSSAAVRLQLWSVSWDLIQERPIAGIGLGVFEPLYQQKLHERYISYERGELSQPPLPEFVFRDPHNWILSFWLNTGILGILSFTSIHVCVLGAGRIIRNKQTLHSASYILALVALLIFGLADTMYWKNDLAAVHWILLGGILSARVAKKDLVQVRTED